MKKILITLLAATAFLQANAGHSLAQAALLDEFSLQTPELPVYEAVGLVDKTDGDVGDNFGGPGVHELAIQLVGLRDFAGKLTDK